MKDNLFLIAMFDTGSSDGEPFCAIYNVGPTFIEGENVESKIRLIMRTEAMLEDGGIENEDLLDVAKTGRLITWRAWSYDDIVGVWADQEPANAKYLGDIQEYHTITSSQTIPGGVREAREDGIELLLGQCSCGYHFTVDHTFIDQVKDFKFNCPACGKTIDTKVVFPE